MDPPVSGLTSSCYVVVAMWTGGGGGGWVESTSVRQATNLGHSNEYLLVHVTTVCHGHSNECSLCDSKLTNTSLRFAARARSKPHEGRLRFPSPILLSVCVTRLVCRGRLDAAVD